MDFRSRKVQEDKQATCNRRMWKVTAVRWIVEELRKNRNERALSGSVRCVDEGSGHSVKVTVKG